MRQSSLFGTTRKEAGQEDIAKNAQLLSRGGYIYKNMAGVYSYMPLGLKVINKIKGIIREELNKLPHTQEMLMPVQHPLSLWEESGRREDYKEIMYTIEGEEIGLGPTHEEIVTDIFRHTVSSYKDLPVGVYQIQTKFRKELRAKSGLLRGREFMMKDLYSFHTSEDDLDVYYRQAQAAYAEIFKRCGLEAVLTEASGGTFSKYSHEYQAINPAGEDTIYLNEDNSYARNKEIVPDESDPELLQFCGGSVKSERGTEVGNIFKLNQRFSHALEATVLDEKGERVEVWMGCYGIGISRLMGVIVELFGDEKGSIQWPLSVAPFQVHILDLTADKQGSSIYDDLIKAGFEVLLDDRERSAGEKFADADLIGSPFRIIISPRSLEKGGVELRRIHDNRTEIVSASLLSNTLRDWLY